MIGAMEFGVLAGPRVQFSVSAFWWIILASTPVAFAILIISVMLVYFSYLMGRFYLYAVPFVLVIVPAMLVAMIRGWMFEVTFSFVFIHFMFALAIAIFEFKPKIQGS